MKLAQEVLPDGLGGELLYLRVEDEALGERRDVKSSASVVFAGDLSWPSSSALPNPGGLQSSPWSRFAPLLQSQDLSLVNLESPLPVEGRPIVKTGPRLRAEPRLAEAVHHGGFGAVSLANNHIRDWGDQGVCETLTACQAAGLMVVGAGPDRARAGRPLVTEVGGLRLGILAIAENEYSIAGEHAGGAAPLRERRLGLDVSTLRADTDAVVVLVHGGNELYPLPRPGLADLARTAAESGAAAVVVAHQHVPSGLEIHRGAAIIYGTGNFLFPASSPNPDWHRGYLVQLVLGHGGVAALNLFPYTQSLATTDVEPMDPRALSAFAVHLEHLSSIVASDAALDQEWQRFAAARRVSYLSMLLGLSRFERRLAKLGVWPGWRMPRRGVPALLNILRCESHREALLTILEQELVELETPSERSARSRPADKHG